MVAARVATKMAARVSSWSPTEQYFLQEMINLCYPDEIFVIRDTRNKVA
jgi:hypothetical protein